LVQVNTESDETKSVAAAKRLIEREKVIAIVGPHSSGRASRSQTSSNAPKYQ
jgi:branched-chain amino acid transport system substrate-binding protein